MSIVTEQRISRKTPPAPQDRVILWRDYGRPSVNVPLVEARHSATGIAWGYGGSGPADLALNILLAFTDRRTANDLYQTFAWEVIAALPFEGAVISGTWIREWIAANRLGVGLLVRITDGSHRNGLTGVIDRAHDVSGSYRVVSVLTGDHGKCYGWFWPAELERV